MAFGHTLFLGDGLFLYFPLDIVLGQLIQKAALRRFDQFTKLTALFTHDKR
ncbi:Uncharacterised protein [Vibrio cholerae]|nr:Uncharacterised protein [Vibrio cholerae]